jgi:uncharacterized protein YchJ
MPESRNNHYVPEWYQRGFLSETSNHLHYLDLSPEQKEIPGGRIITMNDYFTRHVSRCFRQKDLYTTFFGPHINDEIERKLFGAIDDTGSKAVWAFISEDKGEWHRNFTNFFEYIDAQKIRTPKGLDWITNHYPNLGQNQLMQEMQAIRNMHCTIWTEGVREIVTAGESELKFILSDHPVTVYNYAIPPTDEQCGYPNDPSITLKGSQTIFSLDKNHCLILTNYEYASNPDEEDPKEKRTHAKHFRNSLVRTDAFIRSRSLSADEVLQINLIIKARARRFIAATEKTALYPEVNVKTEWSDLKKVLLPPEHEISQFGGEMYVGYDDGRTYYQDAFGRTMPENGHLKKTRDKDEPGPNESCGCGSGKKYKKCCRNKSEAERSSWDVLSIRERNLTLFNGVIDILGLNKDKSWDDIRRELSEEQVKRIHDLYGFLWPLDTDIFSLLPKPDESLKALYTGILDPRVIGGLAVSSSLYFDEVIIQHPFVNPFNMKPEFNPVEVPHKYKQQTLKNIFLLIELMPFIEAGYINFIPDPCVFDDYLRRQMFNMAEDRRNNPTPNTKDFDLMMKLAEDDHWRTNLMLSEEQQRAQIKQSMPDISDEQLKEMLETLEQMKQEDPLALLQENIFSKRGGQITMMNMSPNFELTMYLAQVTGSLVLTDSDFRWTEITQPQNLRQNSAGHPWKELTDLIEQFEYLMFVNAVNALEFRYAGKFSRLRKVFRDLFNEIKTESDPSKIQSSVQRLKQQLNDAFEVTKKEASNDQHEILSSKMQCFAPYGGLVNNNVQRMLLTSGSSAHLDCVPAVIYMEVV